MIREILSPVNEWGSLAVDTLAPFLPAAVYKSEKLT
jgi:hypothetical protein